MSLRITSPGTAIGSLIIGGTPNSVLYLNASGLLSQSAGLLYDDTISFFYTDFIQNVTSLNGLNIQAIDDSALNVSAGNGTGSNNGQSAIFNGGQGGPSGGRGGNLQFNAGTPNVGNGGNVIFNATSAAGAGSHTGGSFTFQVGSGINGGANGTYNFTAPGGIGVIKFDMSAVGSTRTLTFQDLTGKVPILDSTSSNTSTVVGGNGLSIASSTLDSGNLVKFSSTSLSANGNTQTVLNVLTSGANSNSTQTSYGIQTANTHTGTGSTNVGLYATASGGTNNYAGIFDAGNVGINTTTPGAKLHVNSPTATIIASIFKTTDDNATKNLTEWQTSGGSAVASMNCVGDITANSFSNAPNPDTATNGFYFEGTVTKRFNVLVNAAVSNVEAQLLLQRRRAGSFSVTAGDFMGSVTWNTMSFLNGFATANVTGGFSTIDMAFTAVNAAGTSAERVRWTAEGLYGINTSAPSAMLHAKSNVTTTKTAILQNIASQTASALEAQNSSGTPYVTIGPGTLAGDTTNNWLNVTGTFPATRTASTRGVNFEITGAGSSNFELDAFRVNFNAGYTGANFCITLNMVNSNAGTGTGAIGGGAANYGGYLQAIPNTTGHNVGFHGEAGLGVVNLGVQGIALRAKNSGTNIGIVGLANNSGSSPVVVGGWFTLSTGPAAPSTSAALIVDNTGTTTAPVALFKSGTTTKFTIDKDGHTTWAEGVNQIFGTTTGTQLGTVGGASGQKLSFYGSTPIVQPLLATGAAHTVDDIITTLQNLGLVRQT